MIKIEKFNGLVAAPFTPMYKEGNINTEIFLAKAQRKTKSAE